MSSNKDVDTQKAQDKDADTQEVQVVTPEVTSIAIKDILSLQKGHQDLKRQELENEKESIKQSYLLSKEQLRCVAQDRDQVRINNLSRLKVILLFSGIILSALLAFFIYALHAGHKDVVIEVIKSVVLLVGGGGIGYTMGGRKRQPTNQSDDSEVDDESNPD